MTENGQISGVGRNIFRPYNDQEFEMRKSKDDIRIEVAHSSLGLVLVAVSRQGLRAVQIGDDTDALRAELTSRFPNAKIEQSDAHTKSIAGNVVAFLNESAPLDTDLDIRGTPFQQSVWEALQKILH